VVIVAFGAALAGISLIGYIWCVIYYNRSIQKAKRKIYESQKDIIFNQGKDQFDPKAYIHPVQAKLEVVIDVSGSHSPLVQNGDSNQNEV
jgi:hypothetical protein